MSTSTAWAPQNQIETDESAGRALNGKVKESSIVLQVFAIEDGPHYPYFSLKFSELNLDFI